MQVVVVIFTNAAFNGAGRKVAHRVGRFIAEQHMLSKSSQIYLFLKSVLSLKTVRWKHAFCL